MNDDLRKLATAVCNEIGLGTSAKTIVAYCTGVECFHAGRPYDADDVSRCINVLSFFLEWKEKIKHISDRFPCWGGDGYANDIYFEHKVTGDDVMNELTIVAEF